MNAIEEEIADVIITFLSIRCPQVGHRLALFASGELSQRANNVGISRDEAGELDEDAESHAELR